MVSQIRNTNPNVKQHIIRVMINGIGSRTISILGFNLFIQKVSNAIRIIISRHIKNLMIAI
jgi:hypothetical protein